MVVVAAVVVVVAVAVGAAHERANARTALERGRRTRAFEVSA